MALKEKLRSSIYRKLTPMIGEEETAAMLAHFPPRDVEEPATREFLRAELAISRTELRGEMAGLRTELKGEMGGLRTELKGEMAELRTELRTDMADLRTELKGEMAHLGTELKGEMAHLGTELKGEMADLRTDFAVLHGTMHRLANRVLLGVLGLTVAWAGTAVAVAVKIG